MALNAFNDSNVSFVFFKKFLDIISHGLDQSCSRLITIVDSYDSCPVL